MKRLLKLFAVTFILATATVGSGCRSPYHSDRLALMGGLAGAGIGAMVGESTGNPESGALIGAVAGAITGNVIGESMDATEARNRAMIESQLGRQVRGATTINDVIAMNQAGLSDDVIIRHIQYSRMAAPPSSADLVTLSQAGVADRVIQAVQTPPLSPAPTRMPPPVIIEEYHFGPPPIPWYHHDYHHHGRHHHSRHSPGIGWGFTFHN